MRKCIQKKTPDWLATHTRKRKLKIQIKMHGKCSYNAAVINDKLQNYVYTYIHTYIIYLIYTYIFIYTFIYIILYIWYEPPISPYSLRVQYLSVHLFSQKNISAAFNAFPLLQYDASAPYMLWYIYIIHYLYTIVYNDFLLLLTLVCCCSAMGGKLAYSGHHHPLPITDAHHSCITDRQTGWLVLTVHRIQNGCIF